MGSKRAVKTLFISFLLLLSGCAGTHSSEPKYVPVESISFDMDTVALKGNEEYVPMPTFLPANATNKGIAYTIADTSVAFMKDESTIKAYNLAGESTVVATSLDNPEATATFTLKTSFRYLVTSIDPKLSSIRIMNDGGYQELNAAALPVYAADRSIIYEVADTSVARLDGNIIRAVGPGKTTLKIKAGESFSDVETEVPVLVYSESMPQLAADESFDPTYGLTYDEMMSSAGLDVLDSTGDYDVMVIPVEFPDYPFYSGALENIEKAFNGNGSQDTGYWESVSTYYRKSSFGKLNINFDIKPVYTSPTNAKNLTSVDTLAFSILSGAIEAERARSSDGLAKYDIDKDGAIDAVWFVYSAYDYRYTQELSSTVFWAFVTATGRYGSPASPALNRFGWASVDFMWDAPVSSSNDVIDAHTYIHETGHLFGLNDYYNYEYTSDPIGALDMQCNNVGDHNAMTKAALGWNHPIVFESEWMDGASVTLRPAQTTGDCLILMPEWRGTIFDEGIMFELYSPLGLNAVDATYPYNYYTGKMPSVYGIKMYHYDFRLITSPGDSWNKQQYIDYKKLAVQGFDGTECQIGASNTSSYDRNMTRELFRQITLVSSKKAGGAFLRQRTKWTKDDLFYEGDSIVIADYAASFDCGSTLNTGAMMDLRIDIASLDESGARLIIQTVNH